MENLFAPYELALKLKEIGFNGECLGKWVKYNKYDKLELYPVSQNFFKGPEFATVRNEHITDICYSSAPLWDQAFSWFREKCNLGYSIHPVTLESFVTNINNADLILLGDFKTYEEARLECLKKLIELCQK